MFIYIYINMCFHTYIFICIHIHVYVYVCAYRGCCTHCSLTFLDGYCSTVQDLLDWFEVDLGFTELSLVCTYDRI